MDLKEDLQIDIKEIPKETNNTIDLNINIDSKGIGIVNFHAKGFLEYIIIPDNIISTYNILCVNSSIQQDIVCDIKETKGGLFCIRRPTYTQFGKYAESDYTKIYLNGFYDLKVTGGTPETQINIKMEVV